jgi:hypothetical protein
MLPLPHIDRPAILPQVGSALIARRCTASRRLSTAHSPPRCIDQLDPPASFFVVSTCAVPRRIGFRNAKPHQHGSLPRSIDRLLTAMYRSACTASA